MESRSVYTRHINLSDEIEFDRLFTKYYPALVYFACRLLRDRPEAEDIVMEMFTRLWERRWGFSTEYSVKAFLYISVRNACLNFIKRSQKQA